MMQMHRNNLQYFCRTCLEQLHIDALNFHIGQTPYLSKLLIICTSLNIKDDEDAVYPQWLCKKCYDILQHFRHFREMSLQSADVLQKIIKCNPDYANQTTSTTGEGYFQEGGYTDNREIKIEVGSTQFLETSCRNEKEYNVDELVLDSDSSAPSTSTAKKRKNENDAKFESKKIGCYQKIESYKTLETRKKLEHASDDDTQDTIYDMDMDTRYSANLSSLSKETYVTSNYSSNASCITEKNSMNYEIPTTSMPTPTSHTLYKIKKSVYCDDLPLPYILSCGLFVVVSELNSSKYEISSGGCIAECQVCKIKIRGSKRVTSNFLQHLKTKHPQHHNEYVLQKKSDVVPSRLETKHKIFEAKVLKFVVTTYSPMSIIEHPSFVMLFENENISLRGVSNLLDSKYSDMLTKIKSDLSGVNDICCTADIWRGRRNTFFGYTCHWINADFKRKSAALACYRFSKRSPQQIDDCVKEINENYSIKKEKIVCVMVDNGKNFVNSFKEFGIENSSIKLNDDVFDSDLDGETLVFQSALNQLSKFTTLSCVSKTLNTLSTTDFTNALQEQTDIYKIHLNVMKKCNAIWRKCNTSKEAEKMVTIISSPLKTPVATNGNSHYEAIKDLLNNSLKLNEIVFAFNIESFSTSDISYLHELTLFLQPIAQALEFLQKEEDAYYGYLIPTLLILKVKIKKFSSSSEANYLRKILKAMEAALVLRFESIFKLEPPSYEAIVAAMTCPTLKLLNCEKLIQIWQETAPNCSVSTLKTIFVQVVQKFQPNIESIEVKSARSGVLNHPFFDLLECDNDERLNQTNSSFPNYNQELSNFCLDTDNTMNCLNKYQLIKNLFMKLNTPITSSTPVEQLFPFAGIVNNYRWESLRSNNFEKFVLANSNTAYFK